jgi:hypothetical protein
VIHGGFVSVLYRSTFPRSAGEQACVFVTCSFKQHPPAQMVMYDDS